MMNVNEYINTSLDKIKRMKQTAGVGYPSCGYTEDGKYKFSDSGGWTGGFFTGLLYLSYMETKDEWYLNAAREYDDDYQRIADTMLPLYGHDLGFVFTLKDVFDYKITGVEKYKERALAAAKVLLARYNKEIGIIPAWDFHPFDPEADYKGRIICDTMMNLPLLMWAYEVTGEEEFKIAAERHAKNSAEHLIRDDNSAFHVFDFDSKTGEPKGGKTMQGYSDDSCWTRGLSWLVYGFTIMYRYTSDKYYLKAAERVTDYFLSHLSAYNLAIHDFAVADLDFKPWDASANAVVVCAIKELSKLGMDKEKKARYSEYADKIIHSLIYLCSTMYIPELEPLLIHVSGNPIYKKGAENVLVFPNADTSIIFGDYFFFEALMRYKDNDIIIPW